ncbi:MAG TPA: serine/threonine-protein kinase [Thermoflexales bacterium]|nr:serine/threonine-protein kinase [Thermoflexales bacterium]HQX09408.1 serine/threonine-protein kinase [Thermoflexales bacterium]HQY24695.1 serine/threonine-protein kinase [Thermoflexales bacterium]HQZ52473.1 serine/threonine-protein kinase [Thermoflexales bacterium]HRA54514.1 serine/threonine-protein kinase [Thermoflexales bacterium]
MVNKIGRYEIKRELGRGGMAGVYEAHDPRFERTVAVKVLPRELMVDGMFRARFEREAKVIASLEHPGIVPVYDFGEEAGQPYLVMQYMAGGSLAERLALGRLSLAETADLIGRIAPAVDYANSRGVSHRDLKPANIVFDRAGEPRVADFGIARISESKTALTQGVIGTPAYMSPEQWEGTALDGRSDVYSLGVMAFEMLTGQTPYIAETMTGFMKAHLMNAIPDARARVPELPAAAQHALSRALAKARDQRYETASEFARELAAVAQGNPISAGAAATFASPARPTISAPTQVLSTPLSDAPSVIGPSPATGRPAPASDSFAPPAVSTRRASALPLGLVAVGIIALGVVVAAVAALSGAGAAPPATIVPPPPSAVATRVTVAIATPTAPTAATRAATVAPSVTPTASRIPTSTPTRFPTPTPYPAIAPSLIRNCAGSAPVTGVFVARGSCWRYNDAGFDLGGAWKETDFDDRTWAAGRAELGYGDNPTTTLAFGPDPNTKRVTAYFRQPFSVGALDGAARLRLWVWRDDGVVVYLNGLEVARDNLPTGVITASTYARATISDAEEAQPMEFILPAARLTAGINVIAAEVHQDRPVSSDLRFSLELAILAPGAPTSTPRPTRTPAP